MINSRFKCGTQAGLDLGLVGFLAELGTCELRPPQPTRCIDIETHLGVAEILNRLEENSLQLGVLSLEQLLEYALQTPKSSVRLVGNLLGGDCRALVSLVPSSRNRLKRSLGATHPASAFARWEDVSCAFDVACFDDLAEDIPHSQMIDVLIQGRHSLLELNMYWEGMIGYRRGLIRSSASSKDFGIPSAASHVLVSNEKTIRAERDFLREYRFALSDIYQLLLRDAELFSDLWSRANVFPCRPNFAFLLASARVLAPHCEEFVRTSGKFDFQEAQPFLRWFDSRVKVTNRESERHIAVTQLERFLCDLWL